jgi:hypothetical protein
MQNITFGKKRRQKGIYKTSSRLDYKNYKTEYCSLPDTINLMIFNSDFNNII